MLKKKKTMFHTKKFGMWNIDFFYFSMSVLGGAYMHATRPIEKVTTPIIIRSEKRFSRASKC